jgi:uncharacterized membrane protein (UPF0127 family)
MKALCLALALASCSHAAAPAAAEKCVPQKVAEKTGLAFPDGKKITLDVVDTPASREIGLMCVSKMPKNYGMLFVFPQDMFLSFWMKNTLVPLDILWIGADKRITVIHEKLPASTTSTPDDKIASAGGKGQYVLELAAGEARRRKLKAGDALAFSVVTPAR